MALPNIEKLTNQMQKNIVSAGLINNYTLTSAGEFIVPLDKQMLKLGDKLTLQNNRIVVGENINAVKIFAQINFSNTKSGAMNIAIKKNGTTIAEVLNYNSNSANNISLYVEAVMEVTESDYIELAGYQYEGTILMSINGRTHITVEAIN